MSGALGIGLFPYLAALEHLALAPGDLMHGPLGTIHRLSALEGARPVARSEPEPDDLVRHSDDYGRAGNSDP